MKGNWWLRRSDVFQSVRDLREGRATLGVWLAGVVLLQTCDRTLRRSWGECKDARGEVECDRLEVQHTVCMGGGFVNRGP